jgi:mannose-6-phosphate isomerase-like protein (cupin superfamily)
MLKKTLNHLHSFTAGDLTIIREVLHPKNDGTQAPPQYSLAFAELPVGAASVPHVLKNSSELYIMTAGEGKIHIAEEAEILRGGDVALVPSGAVQWIENTGRETLQFYVVVSPPWAEAEEEIL